MSDPVPFPATDPATLMRPRLLVRAARHLLRFYRSERDLHRLIGGAAAGAGSGGVLAALIAAEAEAEAIRRAGAVGYSPGRHVALLGALMAEAARAGPG